MGKTFYSFPANSDPAFIRTLWNCSLYSQFVNRPENLHCRCVLTPVQARGSIEIIDPTGEPLPGDVEDKIKQAAATVYSVQYASYAVLKTAYPEHENPALIEAMREIMQTRLQEIIDRDFINGDFSTYSAQPTQLDPEALEDAIKAVKEELSKQIKTEISKPLYEPSFTRLYRYEDVQRNNPSSPFVDPTIS